MINRERETLKGSVQTCWERVICPGLLPREMSGMFAACSKGGTCGANGLYGVFL
jgi:hypothetical protein